MNSNVKGAAAVHPEAPHGLYRVAIVGAASLKGKELAEVLNQRNFPTSEVKLLDDDQALGQLEALKDEITFIQSVRSEQFEHLDFTFFASDAESTRKNWLQVHKSGSAIVDLSYALEDEPGATLRAPWVERQLGKTFTPELQPGPAVVAHPAATVLALLISRVHSAGRLKQVVATVFEPASEHGQTGMDELHQQTVNLLSFQPLPKQVYDVQVAFNMVSRYGQEASASLAGVHDRVLKHFGRMVGDTVPRPSLLVLQAPIFHSHAFALNVQFEENVTPADVSRALAGEHISIVDQDEEAPNNVNAAGQDDILTSIVPDANDAKTLWLWAASDNLRIAASTAVECAEEMAAARPRGQVQ